MKWTRLLLVIGVLTGCQSANQDPPAKNETTTAANKSHLPVLDLLHADLRKAESEAGAILMKTRSGSRKDSLFISREQFIKEASAFLLPVLDSGHFQKRFSEMSLMDETSGLLHFIYTPQQADTGLQKAIVYISPTLGTDKVSRIYLEQAQPAAAGFIERKMTWKMGHYFIIAEMQMATDGTENTILKKVIWDPEFFEEE